MKKNEQYSKANRKDQVDLKLIIGLMGYKIIVNFLINLHIKHDTNRDRSFPIFS